MDKITSAHDWERKLEALIPEGYEPEEDAITDARQIKSILETIQAAPEVRRYDDGHGTMHWMARWKGETLDVISDLFHDTTDGEIITDFFVGSCDPSESGWIFSKGEWVKEAA